MASKYFEDFEQSHGESFESHGRTVTEADIVNFAGVGAEFHPLHMDAEFAAETHFGKRIAPAGLTISMALGLLSSIGLTDESGIGLYGFDRVRFPGPVFIDDTLTVVCTVGETESREKLDGGLVTLKIDVQKQTGDTVLAYDHKVLIQSKEA
ncbi:MaoC/PaaZ C-terminal domain-containing protein [Haladaptatus sp. ZSTT2]|uniref:MaoC/PaaZ C-terminal domain-containing protein n=1 Tax=Haladaptatus sp. ZSTT2 TaxID=3120515 RepID=UPI00300F5EF9